jgi:hypothetical protein
MVIAKVSLKFKKLQPADKVNFGGGVVKALTIAAGLDKDNPFPELPVTIDDLTYLQRQSSSG